MGSSMILFSQGRKGVLPLSALAVAAMWMMIMMTLVETAVAVGAAERELFYLKESHSPELIFQKLYHNQTSLFMAIEQLSKNGCPIEISHPAAETDIVSHVRLRDNDDDGVNTRDKFKLLIFFNEHADELITTEVGLAFLERLCATTSVDIRAKIDLLMFPIVDKSGRDAIETSYEFCQRKNGGGVDLNRNWNIEWSPGDVSSDTFGGPRPFSEKESTQLLRMATDFKADAFIDVHSGTLGFYTPYSYSTDVPQTLETQKTLKAFELLNPKYCNCDAGGAGQVSGYLAYGTAQDYLFDTLKVPYSIVVEVFDGQKFSNVVPTNIDRQRFRSTSRKRKASHVLEKVNNNGVRNNGSRPTINDDDKDQEVWKGEDHQHHHHHHHHDVIENSSTKDRYYSCFASSNPVDKKTLLQTKENWSSALLDMVRFIAS